MSKKLKIEYHSQHDESIEEEWREKSCAIVCMKMVLNFYGLNSVSITDLIKEGVLIGGYKDGNWHHDILCRIFRNHGFHAYNEEFRSVKVDLDNERFSASKFEEKLSCQGLEKIAGEIENNRPVLVSVTENFGANKWPHVIVINGYEGEIDDLKGFYINDPDSRHHDVIDRFVSMEDFKKYWRKFAIFTYQN